MRKFRLTLMAVLMVMVLAPGAYADSFAPGEGFYLGGFVGAGSGVVQPKVTTLTADTTFTSGNADGGVFEATDGGLGMFGMEGGGWIGYGYKMGSLYAGIEGEMAASDVKFKLTSSVPISVNSGGLPAEAGVADIPAGTIVDAEVQWTGGLMGRLGYYINPTTLLAVRGGVLISEIDVTYAQTSETFYGGGPAVGATLESTIADIDPNLNMRMGFVYTDMMTAPVSGIGDGAGGSMPSHVLFDGEVTGETLSARVGLTYSFFDVGSLTSLF